MAPESAKKAAKTPANEPCPECGGSGFVLDETGARPCACQRSRATATRLAQARIPKKFTGKTLRNFTTKSPQKRQIVEFASDFLRTFRPSHSDHPGKGLLLMGKEGTGKTHIAVAILRQAVEKGYRGLYWNIPDLFLELRRVMSGGAEESEAEIFDEARSVDLLVMDDLGAEKSSEFVTERLYVLINGRYENDRATIVTTNRSIEELRQQLGPRIVSRLCEMCVPVEFPEGDYRLINMR